MKGTSTADFAKAHALIDSADHVVLAMGIDESVESEGRDRKTISLPGVQNQFVRQALEKAADQKKTAVIALGKDIIAAAPAIFDAFYPGQYGANAIATTLFGDNTRLGGKMPYTVYPADYVNTTNMTSMAFNDAPGRSYKYYTGEVEFPFGFGLSYTTFEMSAVSAGLSLTCGGDGAGAREEHGRRRRTAAAAQGDRARARAPCAGCVAGCDGDGDGGQLPGAATTSAGPGPSRSWRPTVSTPPCRWTCRWRDSPRCSSRSRTWK